MSALYRINGRAPDRPRTPLHDFSPAAIMARAHAFAAESAARWAARHAASKSVTVTGFRSPDDILDAIRRQIGDTSGAPLPSLTSALGRRRRAIFGAFDGEATRG